MIKLRLLMWGDFWVGLKSNHNCHHERETEGSYTLIDGEGNVMSEADYNKEATSQEMPRDASNHQELEETRNGFFPRAHRGSMALANTLI